MAKSWAQHLARAKERIPVRACSLLVATISFAAVVACNSPKPAAIEPDYRIVATVKDLMDTLVDPNADALWDSVSTVTTVKGTVDNAPKTDQEWAIERTHVIALLEATNLLKIPGRVAAQPNEQPGDPRIEETPQQITARIDGDRAAWNKYADGLYDAVSVMKKAIDARDIAGISNAGEAIDQACEDCHQTYWYPHQFDNFPYK